MDDRNDNRCLPGHRTLLKRVALAAMITMTATAGNPVDAIGETPGAVESSATSSQAVAAIRPGLLLHAVPASEYITFRTPQSSSVVTVGVDHTGIKPSESTRMTGTTSDDMSNDKPSYAQRPWSKPTEKTLKPYIAPDSLADMVRSVSPDQSIVPGEKFETGLSLPSNEPLRFDDTRDFASTQSINHVGIPVSSDAVTIGAPDFEPTTLESNSSSSVSNAPALSTDFLTRSIDQEIAQQRTRSVADSQGFEVFALENLQPPAPEVPLVETDLPNINATIHAKRLRKLAQAALVDSRSRLRRRATHTARKHALEALRLSIDIEDAVEGGNEHVRDLRIAQNAIRESRDFEGITTTVDWRSIQRMVAVHETEILKSEDLENLSSVQATESYLNLAKTKLVSAAGHSALAAESMLLLGMIEKQVHSRDDVHSGAVSLIYHGAATEIQPNSAEAYREYGRTLLEQGLVRQSIGSLKHSVALKPTRTAYQILLDASRRGGDYDLAQKCLSSLKDPSLFNDTAVVQVPPRQFAASYRPTPQTINAVPSASSPKPQEEPAKEKTRISFRSFFPFGRR